MDENELNQKFRIFEQQILEIQEELRVVEQALIDTNIINVGLDEFDGKLGKKVLASIGRGIYLETKLNSNELLVNVGENNYVWKTIPEVKSLIKEQNEKLKNTQMELEKELDKINNEITITMDEFQKKSDSN